MVRHNLKLNVVCFMPLQEVREGGWTLVLRGRFGIGSTTSRYLLWVSWWGGLEENCPSDRFVRTAIGSAVRISRLGVILTEW